MRARSIRSRGRCLTPVMALVLVGGLSIPSYAGEPDVSSTPVHDAVERAAIRLARTSRLFERRDDPVAETNRPVRAGIIIGGGVGLALGLWYADSRCRSDQNCTGLATGASAKTPNVLITTAAFGFIGAVIGCQVGAWVGGPEAHCR